MCAHRPSRAVPPDERRQAGPLELFWYPQRWALLEAPSSIPWLELAIPVNLVPPQCFSSPSEALAGGH